MQQKWNDRFYPIPDLLEVVRVWDQEVRARPPHNRYCFAPLSPDAGALDANIREVWGAFGFVGLVISGNLLYHSPHKFRHGNAVYGVQNLKDIADLKAVSQNLMHSNLRDSDGILSTADMGKLAAGDSSQVEIIGQMSELLEMLKKSV